MKAGLAGGFLVEACDNPHHQHCGFLPSRGSRSARIGIIID
jgi:hypothetical protein